MRSLAASLLGVPAAMLIAAGLGIVIVTLVSRVRRNPERPPIRWAHLMLGVGMTGAGAILLEAGLAIGG